MDDKVQACRQSHKNRRVVRFRSVLVDRPWIHGVLQTVSDEIEGNHRDENHESRPNRQLWRRPDNLLSVGQHVAPAWQRRLDAKAKETQDGFEQDDIADRESCRDNYW